MVCSAVTGTCAKMLQQHSHVGTCAPRIELRYALRNTAIPKWLAVCHSRSLRLSTTRLLRAMSLAAHLLACQCCLLWLSLLHQLPAAPDFSPLWLLDPLHSSHHHQTTVPADKHLVAVSLSITRVAIVSPDVVPTESATMGAWATLTSF